MNITDRDKSKEELISELQDLRRQLESSRALFGNDGNGQYQTDSLMGLKDERLNYAFGNGTSGIWDWDIVSDKLYQSRQWIEDQGYNVHELGDSAQEWSKKIHPADMDMVLESLKTHLKGETSSYYCEYRMICKDRSCKWVLDEGKVVSRDKQGNPLRMIGTFKDISRWKNTELALRESEERLKNIVNFQTNFIIRTDIKGRLTYWNRKFEELFGWIHREHGMEGSYSIISVCDYHHKRVADAVAKCISNPGVVKEVEIDKPSHNNGIRTTLWDFVCITDTDNNPIEIQCVGVDITDRIKADKEIRETNIYLEQANTRANEYAVRAEIANKAKSVFLANMSHEIRTPLNAIIGFSQLMMRDSHMTESQKDYNNSIIRSSEHLLSLINDILELSKIEAGRIELNPVNIDLLSFFENIHLDFLDQVRQKHLDFIFEPPVELSQYIIIDETKLRRVMVNLIGNAIKFTEEGGIAVRAKLDPGPSGFSRLIVEVQDSGPGIPAEELEKLFRRFEQTSSGINKSSGSGLGLTLSRELVHLMGGEIHVTSEPGKGSIFSFTVKTEAGKPERAQETFTRCVTGIDEEDKTYRILVVDDIRENLIIVVHLLRLVGFETMEAVNGEDAIAKFEEWNPDLILLDIRMPVMDGYEAFRRINMTEKGKNIPVIALTASSFEDDRKKIIALGMRDYIRKPFRENDLFGTIGKALGIKYKYLEEESPQCISDYMNDMDSIIRDVNRLSDPVVRDLQYALTTVDMDLLIDIIGKTGSENKELANYLVKLANNYDYEYIKQLLLTRG